MTTKRRKKVVVKEAKILEFANDHTEYYTDDGMLHFIPLPGGEYTVEGYFNIPPLNLEEKDIILEIKGKKFKNKGYIKAIKTEEHKLTMNFVTSSPWIEIKKELTTKSNH
jgi:hypothetical protein